MVIAASVPEERRGNRLVDYFEDCCGDGLYASWLFGWNADSALLGHPLGNPPFPHHVGYGIARVKDRSSNQDLRENPVHPEPSQATSGFNPGVNFRPTNLSSSNFDALNEHRSVVARARVCSPTSRLSVTAPLSKRPTAGTKPAVVLHSRPGSGLQAVSKQLLFGNTSQVL